MASSLAHQFIEALHQLEQDHDLDTIVALHAEDAELDNPTDATPFTGKDSVRKFWEDYRSVFDRIQSRFHHVLEEDGAAMLEWTSDGTTPEGREFSYDGVSVLEYADGKVHRFRTYFDPRALSKQIAAHKPDALTRAD